MNTRIFPRNSVNIFVTGMIAGMLITLGIVAIFVTGVVFHPNSGVTIHKQQPIISPSAECNIPK